MTNFTGPEPIQSPFNMEAILRADEKLLALWKAHPFIFDLDDKGRIITRYVMPETDRIQQIGRAV